MSLIHSHSTCKGKGQEAQFDFSVRLSFFLRWGKENWLLGERIFRGLEKHTAKSSVPWHPTLGGVMIGSGKSHSGVCCQLTQQFVRWLHRWGCQGQLETSSWLSGLEAVSLPSHGQADLLTYHSGKREERFMFPSPLLNRLGGEGDAMDNTQLTA